MSLNKRHSSKAQALLRKKDKVLSYCKTKKKKTLNEYPSPHFSFYITLSPQECKKGLCFLTAVAAAVKTYLALTLYS